MNNELLRWRKDASKEEWALLAGKAMTTVGYLNQLAYGFRKASPSKAVQIEKASAEFTSRKPVTKESLVFGSRA
ncbi:transcriptional regulator [Pantoea dispersa]|uniref:transcriptional regulator n=1 Tax=Pantoea dispersa TaxID=59814 RepID=UPI0032B50CE4